MKEKKFNLEHVKLKLPAREIGCDANVVGVDRMVGGED